MPPTKERTMHIATNVPPKMAAAIDKTIIQIALDVDGLEIIMTEKTINTKERIKPTHPNPMMVLAPSASSALPHPPMNKVPTAANTARMDPIRLTIPPVFLNSCTSLCFRVMQPCIIASPKKLKNQIHDLLLTGDRTQFVCT